MDGKTFKVKFWGVRGSIASPMTEASFCKTVEELAQEFLNRKSSNLPNFLKFIRENQGHNVHGGNTSCVEVVASNSLNPRGTRLILDMGTGLRPLGNSLMGELMGGDKSMVSNFLISHVHWDHIQGLPFFAPLYMHKDLGFKNTLNFFGGTDWQEKAETCIEGQMDQPAFPVSWKEIEKTTHAIKFRDVFDRFSTVVDETSVIARKLDHPQETYGWRLSQGDAVVAYATDQEPRDPLHPDTSLVGLSKNADLLIIDCQYSHDMYHGKVAGPHRYNWGHSYPLAVAHAAAESGAKNVALFHHDPSATRLDIEKRVAEVETVLKTIDYHCKVFAAWEGLEISI